MGEGRRVGERGLGKRRGARLSVPNWDIDALWDCFNVCFDVANVPVAARKLHH